MNRRQFLKTIGAVGTAISLDPVDVFMREAMAKPSFFGLHPFINFNPP